MNKQTQSYLQPVNDKYRSHAKPLAGGDEPPHDGHMEARVAKLEASMEYVQQDIRDIKADIREIKSEARTDFRLIFGALIAVALGLAALMAKGFHWM